MPSVRSIAVGVMIGASAACGAVGPLVPPESIGVNSTIERQKELEAIEEKRRGAAAATESTESQPDLMLQGQDVNLPPLQPVGTR
jgi:predicted small lipoprotein YifL